MKPEKKKGNPNNRSNLTGEDIDMLHEKEYEPEGNDYSGDYSYKNNIDGA